MDAKWLGEQCVHPCQALGQDGSPCEGLNYGLTKRELFSAMAMQAMIGTAATPILTHFEGRMEPDIAKAAVGMADALLAALAKDQP